MNTKNKSQESTFSSPKSVFATIGVPAIGMALLGGAAYLLYRNRFQIQSLLEEAGVKTPWLNGSVEDSVRSGAAKADGVLRRATASIDSSAAN